MSCVQVKNVFLSYGSGEREEKILNGLCMSVDCGTIYTLIGASGCGKTSLLSCLMGAQKPQSGELTVFGRRSSEIPKLIGYMPQSTSLVAELTIAETLRFFARLHEMSEKEFEKRFEMMETLLHLPARDCQICDLSGGEKRRISLAAAIIHNPRLMVLDEPTVGLDFLLRERVWEFLGEKATREGATVIITTHYISEASKAHRCGFMRNGVLIAEEHPQAILEELGAENLDEAFYMLCRGVNDRDGKNLKNETESEEEKELERVEPAEERRWLRPKVIEGLLVKEFHRMRRQMLEIQMIFLLNVFQLYFFILAIGAIPNDLKFGIVNHEDQHCDTYMVNNSITMDECSQGAFSCEFVNHLGNGNFQKINYSNYDSAFDDFRSSKLFGIIAVPENFTKIVFDESEERRGAVEVFTDESKYNFIGYTKFKIITAFLDFMDTLAERCFINEILRGRPFKVTEMFGLMNFDIRTTLLTCIMLSFPFTIINVIAILIISDARIAGVWNRTLFSGVRVYEIILSYAIECVFIACYQGVSIIITQHLLFGVEIVGSTALVFALITGVSIVSYMLGFFISIIFDRFEASSGIGQMITILTIFTTGLIWPIESVSPWLRPLSYIHPLTFTMLANRDVMLKGHGLCHSNVQLGFLSINCWIIVLALLSYVALSKSKFARV